jgi:hypothetical protein
MPGALLTFRLTTRHVWVLQMMNIAERGCRKPQKVGMLVSHADVLCAQGLVLQCPYDAFMHAVQGKGCMLLAESNSNHPHVS